MLRLNLTAKLVFSSLNTLAIQLLKYIPMDVEVAQLPPPAID